MKDVEKKKEKPSDLEFLHMDEDEKGVEEHSGGFEGSRKTCEESFV